MLRRIMISAWALALTCMACFGQTSVVTGKVEFVENGKHEGTKTFPTTVVWLLPVSSAHADLTRALPDPASHPQLVQKNKSFSPHLLVVPVGTAVEFPNHDPFFHNVFSLFEGKRFDLGLYEAGSARIVHFDRPGISYIFCNIHPQMSAVVIAITTRLYAISSPTGEIRIPDVPYGAYVLHAWSERALPQALQSVTREITISPESATLGTIQLVATSGSILAHKNKYGRDYDDPAPSNSIYPQP